MDNIVEALKHIEETMAELHKNGMSIEDIPVDLWNAHAALIDILEERNKGIGL